MNASKKRRLARRIRRCRDREAKVTQRGGRHDSAARSSLQKTDTEQERFDLVLKCVGRAAHAVGDRGQTGRASRKDVDQR